MTSLFLFLLMLGIVSLAGLVLWRRKDHGADRAEVARLRRSGRKAPPPFSKRMVDGLPDPARRYFLFAIKEGTPLHRVAEITMHGQFGLGDKDRPNYMPMQAEQVLAAPEGFVWKMAGGSGAMRISGSDSGGWTRFWLAGLIPVARAGGTADHRLSSFGRCVSEAVFWTPAAVLPGPGIHWTAVDSNTARLTIEHQGLQQSIDLSVAEDGRPIRVVLQRWSNANADGVYRFQPFGGELSEFREFDGFRLPTHVEAGNHFGTEDYIPFFVAEVTRVRFAPQAP
ncbi:MAG: hypothetical protein OIF48_20760 [Silicimonas sp.]|nr:hypothetical protein [Silicimonas sp.]